MLPTVLPPVASTGFRRYNLEEQKFFKYLGQRHPHHIGIGALYFFDQKGAFALNAICTGLVKGLTRPDIGKADCGVKGHESYPGAYLPAYPRPVFSPQDTKSCPHLMPATGKLHEHACGLPCIAGLPENPAVDNHYGIGGQNPGGRKQGGNNRSLLMGQASDKDGRVFRFPHTLIDICGLDGEGQPEVGQKVPPSRRPRGENQLIDCPKGIHPEKNSYALME